MTRLYLASSSPRRQELLARVVAEFGVAASDVEDVGSGALPDWPVEPLALPDAYQIAPDAHPTLWAWRKAADIARSLHAEHPGAVVLGADTVVVAPGVLLGKPTTPEHALDMLRSLRGRKHYVATGYALVRRADERIETLHAGTSVSAVWMRDAGDEELMGYVASGEPLDKAGAYAVQGLGGKLVGRVEGCYNTVVGLPLCIVRRVLVEAGVDVLPWPVGGYCANCQNAQA